MTEQQKRDYITGRIERLADDISYVSYMQAREYLRIWRDMKDLIQYCKDLERISLEKGIEVDQNYIND
jgi:hypothetical protein